MRCTAGSEDLFECNMLLGHKSLTASQSASTAAKSKVAARIRITKIVSSSPYWPESSKPAAGGGGMRTRTAIEVGELYARKQTWTEIEMQVGDYKSHFAETRITFGADRHASGSARARHLKSRLSKVLATIMGGSDGDYVPPRADLDFTRVDFGLDARRGRRHQHSTNIRNWATCGPKPAAERRKKSLSRRDIAYDRDIQSEARRTLLTATPTHSLSISCRFVMRWSYASSRLHTAANSDSRPGTGSHETWLLFPTPAP